MGRRNQGRKGPSSCIYERELQIRGDSGFRLWENAQMVDEGYVLPTGCDSVRSTRRLFHHVGRFTTSGCRLLLLFRAYRISIVVRVETEIKSQYRHFPFFAPTKFFFKKDRWPPLIVHRSTVNYMKRGITFIVRPNVTN